MTAAGSSPACRVGFSDVAAVELKGFADPHAGGRQHPITASCRDDGGVSSRAMTLPYDVLCAVPTVVLLHAGVADRSMWWDVLPLAGFRAIEPDLAGFGEAVIRPRQFPA